MEMIVKIATTLKTLQYMVAGLVVIAVSQPTMANDFAGPMIDEVKTGLFVQSMNGKHELDDALAKLGLYYAAIGSGDNDGPFSETASDVAGSYSRHVTGKIEEISSTTSIDLPEDGDEFTYSWKKDDLLFNRSYLYRGGRWHSSAKILSGRGMGEKQSLSETRVVQVSGRIGSLSETIYRTVQLPRVIAALYLQSSTIFGYTAISGIGTSTLVVGVKPNGIIGHPFSGTVTALVIYQ